MANKTKKSVKNKKSDLTKKNSMTGKKVIGDFDETFRNVEIIDNGHRGRITILEPVNNKEHQTGYEKDKDW